MSQRTFERNAQRRQEASRKRESVRRRRAGLVAGVAGAAAFAAPAAAQAEPIVVDAGGDTPVAGVTTLREAVAKAEASSTASTITFASSVRGTISLTNGQLGYDSTAGGELTVEGPGAQALAVSSGNGSRIFSFSGAEPITVSGLTLTNSGVNVNEGGAIVSEQTDLTVSNASITNNKAEYAGGGIAQFGGSLTIEGSHIDNNELKFSNGTAGGGILANGAPVSISGSTVDGNEADNGIGGGIAALPGSTNGLLPGAPNLGDAEIDIADSSVSGNRSAVGGGGKFVTGDDVSITRSTFADNTATGNEYTGGPGPIGIGQRIGPSTSPGVGGGAAILSDTSSVTASTFSGNKALAPPAPKDPETPSDPTDPTEPLPLTFNRSAPRSAKTVRVEDGTADGFGGGIALVGTDIQVSNSTVANNVAGSGGGIVTIGAEDDSDDSNGDLETLAKKVQPAVRAVAPEEPNATVDIDNTTVSGNSATTIAGGIAGVGGLGLSSSVVAGNTSAADPDISTDGDTADSEYSLVQVPNDGLVTNPAKPTITGQAAQLGGLANNGGPTQTLLPALTSPAIDKGTANELTTDQRGFARTVDLSPANASDGTDIGAVEVAAPASTPGTTPNRKVTPSSVPASCSRRAISLTDARVNGGKVVLKGLVGSRYYGKKVTIQTDPEGAKASGYSRTASVTASKSAGTFTVSVPKPSSDDYPTVRYRAKIGRATSPALKLPQSLTAKSVKSAKGTITVTGRVRQAVLGKRNKVKIRRLACGRYRTMGSTKPDAQGNYTLTFKATDLRGVSLYRAESSVLVRPGSKKYVKQYARAIAIKTTGQTG